MSTLGGVYTAPHARYSVGREGATHGVYVGNVAKGMRKVLEERGINNTTLRADDMRKILSNHDDFRNEKTILERFLIDRGHKVIMIPKFHCELNPMGVRQSAIAVHTPTSLCQVYGVFSTSSGFSFSH